ncbi:VCBS domain-containing protein [Catenovulum agarivorans]|uniref:VCBS domain-containing protein n=1 Tax=Catenovulum agarivorans TaxID=1172192 RepID=UPI0002DD843E|nr:VCBS domain-containing protein [Catenovulum agarivorans]
MKRKLLTLSIVAALTGCGGSDDQEVIGFTPNTETAPEFVGEFSGIATKHAETGNPTGQVVITDASPGESLFRPLEAVGTYGEFTMSANGTWTYTLWDNPKEFSATPEHPEVTALTKAGLPDLLETFTVTTADGTEKQFTVIIRGIDEPATFGGSLERAVSRDTGKGDTAGTVIVSDANPDEASFDLTQTTTPQVMYGSATFDPTTGDWTYDLDEMNADVMALTDSSQSLTDSFTITSLDGTEQMVTVLVSGVDPVAATFVADNTLTTNEDGTFSALVSVNDGSFASSIAVTDPNYMEETFKPLDNVETALGHVTIDAAGAWSYKIDYNKDAVKAILSNDAVDPLPTAADVLTFETIDGTLATVNLTLEGAQLVPAVVDGLPMVEDGVSSSAVNVNLLTTAGSLTVSDTNSWQAAFMPDTLATTYGSFTIDAAGSWSYTLSDDSVALINAGTLVLPFTEQVTVKAQDGTEVTLPVSITSVEGVNYGAQIAGDSTGTKVWVMKIPGPTEAVGKASFTVRVPESNTKDVKIQFHGSEWQGGDVKVHLLSMALQPRSNAIFILDGTGTSTTGNSVKLDQPLTMGELLKFELTWDGSADALAANGDKPLLTLKLNGQPVTGTESASGSSIVNGEFPSFSTADVSMLNKGPKFFAVWTKDDLPVDLDDFIVYSDVAGTTEIFSERFDADGIAEGVEFTPDYINAGLTNTKTTGVEFPATDKFLRLSNDDSNYGGTTLQFPKQEKGSVSFDVRMSTTAQAGYASLFGATSGSQGTALVDFEFNKFKAFKVRGTTDKPGYIPVIRYPMDEWFPIELSWDATGDGTPTVIMKLDGQLVTEIPNFTLAADGSFESNSTALADIADGVHRIAFKCGFKLNDPASVCDFDNVVVKAADGSEVASENFDSLEAGEDAITQDEVLQSGMKTLGTILNADIVEK